MLFKYLKIESWFVQSNTQGRVGSSYFQNNFCAEKLFWKENKFPLLQDFAIKLFEKIQTKKRDKKMFGWQDSQRNLCFEVAEQDHLISFLWPSFDVA